MVRKEVTMSLKQATILVVDDERSVTNLLSEDLGEEGYSCVTADTGEDALKRLSEDNFDVVLLDLKLPGMSGMDVLKEAKSIYPGVAVIVVTAAGDAQTAVEAMKIGAVDYITKPFESALQEEGTTASAERTGWTRYLDAIAEGVETRLDFLTGHVMTITVIERTIAVARSLGIPEDQIEKWADARRKHIERVNILDSLLDKLEQNPVT
jgi:DNA-binding NtrC family response regulator